jgi:hypothetical protein
MVTQECGRRTRPEPSGGCRGSHARAGSRARTSGPIATDAVGWTGPEGEDVSPPAPTEPVDHRRSGWPGAEVGARLRRNLLEASEPVACDATDGYSNRTPQHPISKTLLKMLHEFRAADEVRVSCPAMHGISAPADPWASSTSPSAQSVSGGFACDRSQSMGHACGNLVNAATGRGSWRETLIQPQTDRISAGVWIMLDLPTARQPRRTR